MCHRQVSATVATTTESLTSQGCNSISTSKLLHPARAWPPAAHHVSSSKKHQPKAQTIAPQVACLPFVTAQMQSKWSIISCRATCDESFGACECADEGHGPRVPLHCPPEWRHSCLGPLILCRSVILWIPQGSHNLSMSLVQSTLSSGGFVGPKGTEKIKIGTTKSLLMISTWRET